MGFGMDGIMASYMNMQAQSLETAYNTKSEGKRS